MPMTLTRSLLTILIPGVVATAPWLLLLLSETSAALVLGGAEPAKNAHN